MGFLIVVTPIILTLIGYVMLIRSQQVRYEQEHRLAVIGQLSTVRAQIENALNNNMLPLRGMLAQVSLHNGISRKEFRTTAKALLAYQSDIRHLALLHGTTIKYVYPEEGNMNAIGTDLSTIPSQRAAVMRAIESRKTVLAGPLALVQGGHALIGRMPIFLSEPGKKLGSGPYWGQIAIVMNLNHFINSAHLDTITGLQIAIRGTDALGDRGSVFYGSQEVFGQNPVLLDISLPAGSWVLAAIPTDGWDQPRPLIWLWSIVTLLLTILWLILSTTFNRYISRHHKVSAQLQEVNIELERRVDERTRALADKQAQLAHAGRLASLGEMATAIAHEIGQPLQIIKTSTGIIREDMKHNQFDPEHTKLLIEKIVANVDRAAAIIQNVRNFSRQEDQPPNHRMKVIQPVKEAVSLFNAQFREHEIYLETNIDETLPSMLVHPQKLQQIIVNLLSNARHAVEKKALTDKTYQKAVTLRLYTPTDRHNIILDVHDNGIGMDETTRRRCMDPFYTTKPMGEGTGLGLSILYGIVKEFHGHIEIESQPDRGTTFRIIFPASDEPDIAEE